MKILSIYTSYPSSVSLYDDGEIIAATHEERFSRVKNDDRFPSQAIDYCLKEGNLTAEDLDGVAIGSFVNASFDDCVTRKCQWQVEDYLKEQYEKWLPIAKGELQACRETLDIFRDKIDLSLYPNRELEKLVDLPDRNERFQENREQYVADYLGISTDKVKRIEHHRCHAAYAYYASPYRNDNVLAFTIDGFGDGLNATIGAFCKEGKYQRLYSTGECNLGRIYRYITLLLGMKPNEHEFKVMGLAPYGKAKYAQKALNVFRDTLYVDGIEFKWKVKPTDSYFWFKERLEGVRFDNIAYALQLWVEELLCQWVENAIAEFGISKIVISGGVAMNIKAMGEIAKLDGVKDIFVAGSGSDESIAIGAGICLAEDLASAAQKKWNAAGVASLPHLYLGPKPIESEEDEVLDSIDPEAYSISLHDPTRLAELLVKGKILATCVGRMEFGQRALGNRSILADPVDLNVKEKINSAIKNRDFWMPFAPVMLESYMSKYLINPKDIDSPHMTIGFDSTPEGYRAMIAACHPSDKTVRAQVLKQAVNPFLHSILSAFSDMTGRGAILNTSFNLHGSPIVNTPQEAFEVIDGSGLDGLILSRHLILKRS